MQARRAWV